MWFFFWSVIVWGVWFILGATRLFPCLTTCIATSHCCLYMTYIMCYVYVVFFLNGDRMRCVVFFGCDPTLSVSQNSHGHVALLCLRHPHLCVVFCIFFFPYLWSHFVCGLFFGLWRHRIQGFCWEGWVVGRYFFLVSFYGLRWYKMQEHCWEWLEGVFYMWIFFFVMLIVWSVVNTLQGRCCERWGAEGYF